MEYTEEKGIAYVIYGLREAIENIMDDSIREKFLNGIASSILELLESRKYVLCSDYNGNPDYVCIFDSDSEVSKFIKDMEDLSNSTDDPSLIVTCKEISFNEFDKVTNGKYDEIWRYGFYGDLNPLMFCIWQNKHFDKIIEQEKNNMPLVFEFASNGYVQ